MPKLKSLINETVVEKEFRAEFDRFGALTDQIEQLSKQLDDLKKQRDPLLKKYSDIIEKTSDESLQSEKWIMAVKRKGFERFSPSYKTAFTDLVKQLNDEMKKVADQILFDATDVSKVATSIKMMRKEPIDELKIKDFLKKLKQKILSLVASLKKQRNINKKIKSMHDKMDQNIVT